MRQLRVELFLWCPAMRDHLMPTSMWQKMTQLAGNAARQTAHPAGHDTIGMAQGDQGHALLRPLTSSIPAADHHGRRQECGAGCVGDAGQDQGVQREGTDAHTGLWNESTMGQHSAGRHMLQGLLLKLDTAEIITRKGSGQMQSDLRPPLVHTSQLSRGTAAPSDMQAG